MDVISTKIDRRSLLSQGGVLLMSTLGLSGASPSPSPIVETVHGKISGAYEAGVCIFRGVRYAATTGGRNRFRAPQPVEPWTGIYEAVRPGPSAPQLAASDNPRFSWYSRVPPGDEDCLCLDIFTPATGMATSRPVMVWFHGGG